MYEYEKSLLKLILDRSEHMPKIRVLHIVSTLMIGSGVIEVVMNYYKNIDLKNIQFDFLYFIESETSYREEIKKMGGRVFYIDKPSLSSLNEYRVFFRENSRHYIAVHLHEVYLNAILLPMAKKNGVENLITHSHTTQYSDKRLSSYRNKILCLPINFTTTWRCACSIAAGKFLYGDKFLNMKNSFVLNNAIDCKRFKFDQNIRDSYQDKLGLDNKFVIGHIGRFNEQKNHEFLIEIFLSIKKKKDNAILLLIGDGPLMEVTQEKAKRLGVYDSVVFLGRRNDIQDLLNAMDIFILPSLFEGLPVVGVEAQASGLPIVLSTEITREIGLESYKYIDLDKSPEYWANEILDMKLNTNRDKAYKNIAENGFDIAKEARKLEDLYLDMGI